MRQLELNEIKAIELNILKQMRDICEDQNFRYFLVGGTLLGAVRHKGFIPWDDDIDVGMPRADYEKFIDYCVAHEVPFEVICNRTNNGYGYMFAKVIDKNTTLIEKFGNKNNIDMGVYIDIFPIDGLGDTYDEALRNLNKTRFCRELLVAANWRKFFRSKTRSVYYEPVRFAFYCMSRMVSFKKLIGKIESKYDKSGFDKSQFVGCVCGAYRNKEIFEYSVYSEYTDIQFEDDYFKCPRNYVRYLSNIYGDYMQLPPEDKRVTHHTFDAYFKE